jgi:hypothetical protein
MRKLTVTSSGPGQRHNAGRGLTLNLNKAGESYGNRRGRRAHHEARVMSDDIVALQLRYPGWEFEARWTVAGTGPDARYLIASKGTVTVRAWSAAELAREIESSGAGK